METHPEVSLIWNYFPITLVFWTPIREIANVWFFLPRILTYWLELVWNSLFESLFYLWFNILSLIILTQHTFKPLLLWTWFIDILCITVSTNVFYWPWLLTVFILAIEGFKEKSDCNTDFVYKGDGNRKDAENARKE